VFLQITRTTPLRRTILQFSQIRLTLARTFISRQPLNIGLLNIGLATAESEIIAQSPRHLK
jgi:hypothetical protein